MDRAKSHLLTAQVASASLLLLWSQLTGLLTHLEQDAGLPDDRQMKEAVTSYRESPVCLSQSITSSSEAPDPVVHPTFPVEAADEGDLSASERRSVSLQRSLLSTFQKLEAKVTEKTQTSLPEEVSLNIDGSSLKEQHDAGVVAAFLKPPIVDLLIELLDELREGQVSSPTNKSMADDSTRHETLELSSSSTDRMADRSDSDASSVDENRLPLFDTMDSRHLIYHIFNSSLFNFCLDRIVEARNRFHAKELLRGEYRPPVPGPPTLGIQGFTVNPVSSVMNGSEPSTEVQHPSKATDSDQAKRIARLTELKRARESELREQAKAKRNLKVQVSAHMSLFRALADLASFPIEVINDVESDDTDRQITSSTELNDTETDTSTVDKSRDPRVVFHRLPRTERGRRPRVAVPNVPPEIAAVLKKEKVHGLQIKRAVEAVVALKAEQLDLIVANLSLEGMLQFERMAKQDSLLAHTRQLSQRPSHILRPPTIQESPAESDYMQPTQMRCRNIGMYNQMDPLIAPPRGVSPMLRPLQSSPHVTGSDYHMVNRPGFAPSSDEMGPLSPPYCQYSVGSAPYATVRRPLPQARWSPEILGCHRRGLERVPSLRYPGGGGPSHVHGMAPFATFGQNQFPSRLEAPAFAAGEVDAISECDGTHMPVSPRMDGGLHVCYPHQHGRPHGGLTGTPFRQRPYSVNRSRSFMTYQHPETARELCQSMSVMINDGGELTPSQTLGEDDMHRSMEDRTDTNPSARGSLATPSRKSNKGGALAASWSNVKKTILNVTRGAKHKKEDVGE